MHSMIASRFAVCTYKPAGPVCALTRRGLIVRGRQFGSPPFSGEGGPLDLATNDSKSSGERGLGVKGHGEIDQFGFPRVPFRGAFDREKCEARRRWIENFTGADLKSLSGWWGPTVNVDPGVLKGNIEGPIGLVRIPVAVAGPVLIHGEYAKGLYVVPMATTEGALVASTSRGATAINASGGVEVNAYRQRMVRAPMFYTDSPKQANRLGLWIKNQLNTLQEIVKSVTQRGRLTDIDFFTDAEILHVRFVYTTSEAAGQNMTTTATWKAVTWLLERIQEEFSPDEVNIQDYVIETTVSGDKRQSSLNILHGRGISTYASVHIPEEVMQSVLKVTSSRLLRMSEAADRAMHAFGMAGANYNSCNVLAAVYAAAGQDIACAVEGSQCILSLAKTDREGGGIHATLRMPSLVVGTVGGGTDLPTQRDCLNMMQCSGPQSSFRLAEIITAATLCCELSLAAALASNQFARAHERLGRNKPTLGVRPEYISDVLFQRLLNHLDADLVEWKPFDVDASTSILSDLTASDRSVSKLIGHFAFHVSLKPRSPGSTSPVHHDESEDGHKALALVLKCKATDGEVVTLLNKMAVTCGEPLAGAFDEHKWDLGFRHCHRRELAVASLPHPEIRGISPTVYDIWENEPKEIHAFCMEYLSDATFSHLRAVDDVSKWSDEDVRTVLRDAGAFHGLYFAQEDKLSADIGDCLDPPDTVHSMKKKMPLWLALIENNSREFPHIWSSARKTAVHDILANVDDIWGTLEAYPRTLVHNDLNPRNLCLRREPRKLCAYDWELAAVNAPQHDLVEFLAFVTDPSEAASKFESHAEFYRQHLMRSIGDTSGGREAVMQQLAPGPFWTAVDYCAFNLLVQRMALYTMTHEIKEHLFLQRVVDCLFSYIRSRASHYPHLRLGDV